MTIHLPKDVERGILAAVQNGQFASFDAAMTEAANLLLEKLGQTEADQTAPAGAGPKSKPIWEEILDITADVPADEWDKLPSDLAEQHDHYLYGTPRRPNS